MDSLLALLVITILILLNGFYVAAEFAIVSAPRAAIDRRAAQGHRPARLVSRILNNPRRQDRYIATAQLGITLASLGLGMYGEHVVAEWLADALTRFGAARWLAAHAVASVMAIAILTYFHIVIGEMVPKSLALQQAEKAVLWITPPMLATQGVFYPLVVGLNGIGNMLLRLLGINRQVASSEHYYSAEELQFIVKESQEGGLLRAEAGRVLRDLFAFGALSASEVMVPRVKIVGIRAGTEPDEVRSILLTSRHTRYPVYRNDLDHILGVIHIKDLLRKLLNNESVLEADARPIPFVPETATLDTVLTQMRRDRAQMMTVMDEHGGTAGLVTIQDLFAEVVGQIDETADQRPELYTDRAGRLYAKGTVRLAEVGERLNRVLEHEEIDSVSGLVLALLGRPPTIGDSVEYERLLFEVISVEGRGVKECRITTRKDPAAEPLQTTETTEGTGYTRRNGETEDIS